MNLILMPLSQSVNIGSPAPFTCIPTTTPNGDSIIGMQWFLSQGEFDKNITTAFSRQYGSGTLTFTAPQKGHNETAVRCQALLESGLTANSTDDGLLLVFS